MCPGDGWLREQVAAAGTKLAYLLYYCPDEEILVNAVVALSYLVPGANDTGDLMKRFVELSRYAPCKSQRARLILMFSSLLVGECTQACIDSGAARRDGGVPCHHRLRLHPDQCTSAFHISSHSLTCQHRCI